MTMTTKAFNICEAGTNNIAFGLENIPSNHAQLMMLVPANTKVKPICELAVGESATYIPGTHGGDKRSRIERQEIFTVVRTA
jgi:hypothetical protein